MISESEFRIQTQTFEQLEDLETIIIKRLPIHSQEEIIIAIQSIYDSMEINMNVKKHAESILLKAPKRYKVISQKVREIQSEIAKTDVMIQENINTVENFILPNINGLESTLQELESTRGEIEQNLAEVNQAIDELSRSISEVYAKQSESCNPEIVKIIKGYVSKEDCEKELEDMSNKIKSLEDEIKCKRVEFIRFRSRAAEET